MNNTLHAGHLRSLAASVTSQLQYHVDKLNCGVEHEKEREAARDFCRFVLNSSLLEFVAILPPQDGFDAPKLTAEIRDILRRCSGGNQFTPARPADIGARLQAIEHNTQLIAGLLARQIL